jgi:hypothetical protein
MKCVKAYFKPTPRGSFPLFRRESVSTAYRITGVLTVIAGLFWSTTAWAQQMRTRREPHIGYAYPAGAQSGTSVQIVVGGQYLDGVTDVLIAPLSPEVSGTEPPKGTFVRLTKPLTNKQANDLAQKLREIQDKVRRELRQRRAGFNVVAYRQLLVKFAAEEGITEEMLKALEEFRKYRTDPKRQFNPQIAERATVLVSLSPNVQPGWYMLRLKTVNGISDPVRFHVTSWKEILESEPNDKESPTVVNEEFPVVLNGQIQPGDVDYFRIHAKKGQHLVVAVLARELIPYLADAVPGWFQATLRILDSSGREMAYVDDFWFHPDPVLAFDVPSDGDYVIEIKDAVYRGRDDFVYRIVVGEVPYVTGVFPVGGRVGENATLQLMGWNLPEKQIFLRGLKGQPGIRSLELPAWARWAHPVQFALSEWPEAMEHEPNDTPKSAEKISIGTVVNARIDRPGDQDVFRFTGTKGQKVVAEVIGRRVFSPVDSLLRILDEQGNVVGVNDDFEDKSVGLLTHHADSYLEVTLPRDGAYFVEVTDMQHQGGEAFVYRLRLSLPRPDFELRVVPSVINTSPGTVVPVDVYAVRRDGFDQGIELLITKGPEGTRLSGGWIPPGTDHVVVTLTVPRNADSGLVEIELAGKATANGQEIVRKAVPADDMMQAFYYHHLVPAERFALNLSGRARYPVPWTFGASEAVRIPAGGEAEFRLPLGSAWFPENTTLQLTSAPEGITLAKVDRRQSGYVLVFQADKEKIKPGTRGNLILGMFVENRPRTAGSTALRTQRFFAGCLPALPFEVVSQ